MDDERQDPGAWLLGPEIEDPRRREMIHPEDMKDYSVYGYLSDGQGSLDRDVRGVTTLSVEHQGEEMVE